MKNVKQCCVKLKESDSLLKCFHGRKVLQNFIENKRSREEVHSYIHNVFLYSGILFNICLFTFY